MKKTLVMLMLGLAVMTFGAAQSYAVPVIDGVLTPGEWDNIGYTYYLSVNDPNEVPIVPDTMDIARVILLQEQSFIAGGTETTPITTDDGVYLMIQVYSTPTSLEDPDADPAQVPVISMSGDFFGDGLSDGFNLFLRQLNTNPFSDPSDADSVSYCLGTNVFCNFAINPGNYSNYDLVPGALRDRVQSGGDPAGINVYEYFLPTGHFGTPVLPFPASFVGTIRFDNGSEPEDDVVMGSVAIPEPGTMLLFGSGLLGLLGFGVRFKK